MHQAPPAAKGFVLDNWVSVQQFGLILIIPVFMGAHYMILQLSLISQYLFTFITIERLPYPCTHLNLCSTIYDSPFSSVTKRRNAWSSATTNTYQILYFIIKFNPNRRFHIFSRTSNNQWVFKHKFGLLEYFGNILHQKHFPIKTSKVWHDSWLSRNGANNIKKLLRSDL